jgi:PAS domain S-box-containing protein
MGMDCQMDMLSLMRQYACYIRLEPDQRILEEGGFGDSFFYIIKGRVQVAKKIGGTEKTLRELFSGDFFGELALIHDKPRAASVITVEDTELYELGRESFYEMLRSNPKISMEIFCTSSNWLLESDKQYIEQLQRQTAELALLLQQKDQLADSLEMESRLLAQEKEKYQSLVENSLVGVYVVQGGRIIFANNRFLKMSGYQSMDDLGCASFNDLVISESKVHIGEDVDAQEIDHYEIKARMKSGEERIWEIRSVPIIINNKRATLSNASDLTEKKRLEKENEKTKMQLMQESKLASIGFLSAGIAHNLNNPLASIYMVAQLIQQEHPEMSEAERIIQQCRNMMNIIKSLMTKSRMDQSDEVIEIDFNTLLQNELKFYEANLDFKHTINKDYDFEPGLPVTYGVYSDFSQAIMNIVQNAVDAMYESSEKRLGIKTYSDSESIYIDIADTGCGISEEHLDKIFDPFFSTKPVMSRKKGNEPAGTGLGMASSLQLIQKYNGNIKVKSNNDSGTIITLILPISKKNEV